VQPAPALPSYDRSGLTLYLGAKFPRTPDSVKVYALQDEKMATTDDVRALAEQFKMDGEIYELTGQLGTSGMLGSNTEYLVVDGNRQLNVRSDRYFIYIPDYVSWTTNMAGSAFPQVDAESAIKEFMQAYGFNFEYRLEKIGDYSYAAVALSPDGLPMLNDGFQPTGLTFQFNQNGIAMVDANLLKSEDTASMGVISAEEAFQKILDTGNYSGYLESGRGGSGFLMTPDGRTINPEDIKTWLRVRPLDVSMPYNGWLSSTGKSVDGGAPFVMLNGYPVTGNVGDVPADMQSTYIEAQGQFHEKDGVKTFEMESWKALDSYGESIAGVLRREGDHCVLESADGKTYILQDVPDDVPLPLETAYASGVMRGDIFDWDLINNIGIGGGGGGGGGGGAGFYKINFTGEPVPFPTPTPAPADSSAPVSFEGLRGMLMISRMPEKDGTQTTNYIFTPYEDTGQGSYLLQGNVDSSLDAYHNRPIDVWGTTGGFDKKTQQTILQVERYEAPYPDLQFQLIGGEQRVETLDGQDVLLINADDGVTYIALLPYGAPFAMAPIDMGKSPNPDPSAPPPVDMNTGRKNFEALIIPDETVLGYPGMRVFNSAPEEMDGAPYPLEITNDEPYAYMGPPQSTYMTIEKIELAYFTYNQRYGESQYEPFFQPVWRFYGHYEDGMEFEILVQALKPEFLLPELDMPPMDG
jgi:hypothetical protein